MASKDWIQTLGSRQMKPQAITKEMVGSIEEIAHALSMKCRFTGQCSTFYSVILEALGLSSIEPLIYSPEVKRMDLAMLAAEKRDLFPTEAADWGLPEQPPTEARITVDSSHLATVNDFLRAFDRYFR